MTERQGPDLAQFTAAGAAVTPVRMLDTDGSLCDGVKTALADAEILELLQLMLLTRAVDEKCMRLHRQGRFGTFSQVLGQEAAIVGSAAALDPGRDWVVPQYRELPAMLRQGFPLENFILYFTGDPRGGHIPDGVRCLPLNIALASQLPHAVGLAWGEKRKGTDSAVLAYFGDGASSEGDAHESMNLAGIVGAPVVFFLSNNGWAISTPRSQQSAAVSLASRAVGYGMAGVVVDGNDLLAVHAVTSEAVARAHAGGGPTLIEAITYRVGAHNTADDPTRYVDDSEAASWLERDPVRRVQRYLEQRGHWSDALASESADRHRATVDAALASAAAKEPVSANLLFDDLYAHPPARVVAQRAEWITGSEQS